jgi:hypothetical protein
MFITLALPELLKLTRISKRLSFLAGHILCNSLPNSSGGNLIEFGEWKGKDEATLT